MIGGAPLLIREVAARAYPSAHLNITATTSGAAQTLLDNTGKGLMRLMFLSVTNTTGTAATLSLHSIPSGGSIGDTNKELDARNVPANTTIVLHGLINPAIAPDTVVKVYSDTNGALNIRGAIEETT